MEDGPGELNVSKVAGTLGHVLAAGLALEVPVDGAHAGVQEPPKSGPVVGIHVLVGLYAGHRHGFLFVCLVQDGLSLQGEHIYFKEKEKGITVSSGERVPNWTKETLLTGADECWKPYSPACVSSIFPFFWSVELY